MIVSGGIPSSANLQICQNVFTSTLTPQKCHNSRIWNCSVVNVVSSSVGETAKQLNLLLNIFIQLTKGFDYSLSRALVIPQLQNRKLLRVMPHIHIRFTALKINIYIWMRLTI